MTTETHIVAEMLDVKRTVNRLAASVVLPQQVVIPWTWITAFAHGWVNYASGNQARYTLLSDGMVHLSGAIKNGTVNGTSTWPGVAAFTLPADCRPSGDSWFAVSSANAFGQVCIHPNGQVCVFAPSHNSLVQLDGICFPVAPAWTWVSAFQNYWQNFSGDNQARFTKLSSGLVVLAGLIDASGYPGGSPPIGQVAFQLPSGYTPALPATFAVPSYNSLGCVIVESDGSVGILNPSSPYGVTLDGIRFAAV